MTTDPAVSTWQQTTTTPHYRARFADAMQVLTARRTVEGRALAAVLGVHAPDAFNTCVAVHHRAVPWPCREAKLALEAAEVAP